MIKVSKNKTPILSIIILYYNSREYLDKCLKSLSLSKLNSYTIETIVVNNGSIGNYFNRAQKKFQNHPVLNPKFINSKINLGFSKGNNFGLKFTSSSSKYVLFSNDDIKFSNKSIRNMIDLFEKNNQVDAATGYIISSRTGKLAPESHRGFPTPWNTFWHFFGMGIPKLFPKLQIFHGYLGDYRNYYSLTQIDACQGCFIMLKRSVGNRIGWWNEKYFFLGEDLDLCFKLKQSGYKLFFNPSAKVIHYHGISSGLQKSKSYASRDTKIQSALASTAAMRIFYNENLIDSYPKYLHWLIQLGIKLIEIQRIIKAKYL